MKDNITIIAMKTIRDGILKHNRDDSDASRINKK